MDLGYPELSSNSFYFRSRLLRINWMTLRIVMMKNSKAKNDSKTTKAIPSNYVLIIINYFGYSTNVSYYIILNSKWCFPKDTSFPKYWSVPLDQYKWVIRVVSDQGQFLICKYCKDIQANQITIKLIVHLFIRLPTKRETRSIYHSEKTTLVLINQRLKKIGFNNILKKNHKDIQPLIPPWVPWIEEEEIKNMIVKTMNCCQK